MLSMTVHDPTTQLTGPLLIGHDQKVLPNHTAIVIIKTLSKQTAFQGPEQMLKVYWDAPTHHFIVLKTKSSANENLALLGQCLFFLMFENSLMWNVFPKRWFHFLSRTIYKGCCLLATSVAFFKTEQRHQDKLLDPVFAK